MIVTLDFDVPEVLNVHVNENKKNLFFRRIFLFQAVNNQLVRKKTGFFKILFLILIHLI